ncbi:MAG: succinate dehydrogenase/fumarate reductase iron-sulfur subunit [Verrucomicrobiales bacterium]
MNLTLQVWRQKTRNSPGRLVEFPAPEIPHECSFLEMLDIVNERLITKGDDPIAFDHDCREGICGMCSLTINGKAHGGKRGVATCQLHMRTFAEGDTIIIEPFRAKAFPVVKDLVVDRENLDRIIQAGGFINVRTGSAPEANSLPVPKPDADRAFDAAACIGCGACVAACKKSSPMLFVAAKAVHLNSLPQGHPERHRRVLAMVRAMDRLGFGNCTNQYECAAVCPKEIPEDFIALLNRDFRKASWREALG